jgi:hypothetical protein
MPYIFFTTEVFHLKIIYVVNNRNALSNVKIFLQKVLPVMRYGVEKFKNCFSIF